ncbi:MAG: Holliday junction branch migration protein RuvA [Veillonellaceae bacterium]|nr:Holliday junction branch migration protein RuvA [Veillonellaceae bacterium]
MIGYLRGQVTHIFLDACFIDVHGVGYRVYASQATLAQLEQGQEAMLYTYMNVREDALQLYGFITEEEYKLFLLLIGVSGIGPKVGLGILSGLSPQAFSLAVANADVKTLVKLPGIGKKSAERLVLELKDKIGTIGQLAADTVSQADVSILAGEQPENEVLAALLSLGYREEEVAPVLASLDMGTGDTAQLLKKALAALGKGK